MTNYTWPAWTSSHKDFFTRNIITTDGGIAASELAERNRFESNAKKVPWPDASDVEAWMVSQGQQVGSGITNAQALQEAVESERAWMSERVQIQVHPVDPDTGDVLYDQLELVPPNVRAATIIYIAKEYNRSKTPDGVLGSDAFGGTVRMGRWDPDAERLLDNKAVAGRLA